MSSTGWIEVESNTETIRLNDAEVMEIKMYLYDEPGFQRYTIVSERVGQLSNGAPIGLSGER